MSDGDIWGGGRLSPKWLATGNQREVDLAQGRGVSVELADLTARAVADTLRRADRRACEAAVEVLLEMRAADVTAWTDAVDRLDKDSRDAEIACRAAISARMRIDDACDATRTRLIYFETYTEQVCGHLEAVTNAQFAREGAPSALRPEDAMHFARQLAKGSDARVVAPRRKSPARTARDILGMEVV